MIHGLFSREHRQTTSPAAFTADPSTTPGAVWRSSSLLEPFSTEQSSARWLAQIRILTCLILLGFTLREDLAGTAELPERMRVPMGVLRVLYKLPIGLQTLMDSPKLLTAFQVLTATLLLAGVVGWRTRITLPLAAAATLLFGAVWRQYCHLYHTGLLPWYVLAVLCITPCGDALSIDRRRRKEGVQPASNFKSAATYQWSLMLCWAVVAIPYTMCGLSKLASGGLHWWSADNLRAILYVDNLQPMSFKLGWGMHLAEAPDWFLSASAFGVVAIETFFIAVLFSRWARLVLPAMMASIHIGILLFQNVPFPDLIIYQLIFYNVLGRQRQQIASTFARLPSAFWSSSFSPSLQRLRHSAASSVAARVYAAALVLITVTFAAVWIGKVEFYPPDGDAHVQRGRSRWRDQILRRPRLSRRRPSDANALRQSGSGDGQGRGPLPRRAQMVIPRSAGFGRRVRAVLAVQRRPI